MNRLFGKLAAWFGAKKDAAPGSSEALLKYDKMIFLDAEDLAETGVAAGYEAVKPALRHYLLELLELSEHIDAELPSYGVSAGGKSYAIFGPDLPDAKGQSWARATFALFDIVNRQLEEKDVSFYAVNGGNDLGGLFLTPVAYKMVVAKLESKRDWPYLPTLEPPWYGQPR